MNDPFITLRCLEIEQPIGTFYIGGLGYEELRRISYADIRKLSEGGFETYLGIQRQLSPKRVAEIKRYVEGIDATFPTSIILAISSDDVEYDPETGTMQIRDDERVAKIIDGQHRIEGLSEFSGEKFDLNVTIFIDMDIEDQAMVFATINLAQTKVSKSLVYDLYEFTTSRSPQKTSHNIAKLLNSEPGSPFEGRIKILGRATRKYQTLTQAAVVEALLRLISGTTARAEEDRELIKRGKVPKRASESELKRLVFRNMFLDQTDAKIAKVVWNFFIAVQQRWPKAWEGVHVSGNMLPRTNGFRGLMRFLPHAYMAKGGPPRITPAEGFLEILNRINLNDSEFTTARYEPGTSGESRLYSDLISHSGLD